MITILYFNRDTGYYDSCITMEYALDFEGIFVISAGTALRNPDRVFLDTFAVYNPEETVSEGHNQHFHDAHKKKAIHDMAQYDSSHLIKDLIHNTENYFSKD